MSRLLICRSAFYHLCVRFRSFSRYSRTYHDSRTVSIHPGRLGWGCRPTCVTVAKVRAKGIPPRMDALLKTLRGGLPFFFSREAFAGPFRIGSHILQIYVDRGMIFQSRWQLSIRPMLEKVVWMSGTISAFVQKSCKSGVSYGGFVQRKSGQIHRAGHGFLFVLEAKV